LVKYENDSHANSQNILNRWKNYFCQLLNIHGVNDVMQTVMHTDEPLVSEPTSFDVQIATK